MVLRSMETMNSMRASRLGLRSGKTCRKKQPAPVFPLCSDSEALPWFLGRTIFFTRLWEVLSDSPRKAAQWPSCIGFLLTRCYKLRWRMSGYLWLPLFPSLWDDKTPLGTQRSRFLWMGRLVLRTLQTWRDFMFDITRFGIHLPDILFIRALYCQQNNLQLRFTCLFGLGLLPLTHRLH